ncbi:hypothetical protein M011DRAFT_468182 [Sporormia fimetaria CBS 119925]|uniref:Cell wall protein SED1 n=1 Tax=Sporormia fimetaria CBS 119925 TaxID=1340428 RepID=A0A6A6V8P4_9PLEO|nr:hypothetical protein M011DRAFT_468182 [Sporormia fimetaria CBS 119925]
MRFIVATAIVGAVSAQGVYPPTVNNTVIVDPTLTEEPTVIVDPTLPPVYETVTVSEYTTYCPGPTEITQGTKTYTVTESTTLTITDCPCTITKTPEVPYPTETLTPEVPEYPTSHVPQVPHYPTANSTVAPPPAGTGYPSEPSASAPSEEFPGAASQMGVGLLAVIGALAAFL